MLKKWYFNKIRPDYFADDLLSIDWAEFRMQGSELVFVDIDNTLAKHGSRVADAYAHAAIDLIKQHQLSVCILSNALSNRIEEYASSLNVDYMGQANKPSGKKIFAKLAELNINPEKSILVGDQLFTDIWAGNRAGCITILVKRRFDNEAIQIKIKRRLERFLFRLYETDSSLINKTVAK